MKILEVISDTNIGGAGVLLVNRLRHTDLSVYQTTVILPRGSALIERLRCIDVDIIEINCSFDKSFEIGAIIKYIIKIRKVRPDVINCHGALSARIAAKLCRVPVKICTRHCVFPPRFKNKTLNRIFGYFNSSLSERFIAVAHAARENLLLLGVQKNKISVIINGADPLNIIDSKQARSLKAELGILENECVLVMNARLEAYKGHVWFFEAVKLLIDDGVAIKVLLLGDGTQREALKELSIRYGIDKNVIFIGFVNDVSPYMNIADINVNCSTGTETSSLALSEGMSIGLPAIVSDYGGNPYMVRHGVNGFVCRCYAHTAIAKYVKRLMSDKSLYERMSVAARSRFEKELNASDMTKKTTALYESLYKDFSKRGHIPRK